MTSATLTLSDFLLARIAEDEVAARVVPPLDHNFDMGGNRQDERFVFGRTLPSSADGMGNWSKHQDSPATADHFSRHDPARVLAECEAKRRIVEEYVRIERGDYADSTRWLAEDILALLALPYADHPDYRPEWRPAT